MFRTALAFGFATAITLSAQADVLYSWENTAQNWEAPSSYSAVGATDGAVAAVWAIPNGGWNFIESGYGDGGTTIPILAANDTLQVDVTPLHDLEDWENLEVSLYLQGGNVVGGGWSHNPTSTFAILTSANNGQTTTISLDYSHLPIEVGNTGWVQVRIITQANGGYAGDVAFDNLRAVPEPASLALASLGALALFARRRA